MRQPGPDAPGLSTAPRREPIILAVGVFALSLLLYLTALAPAISRGGDCGELTADSWRLGIGHPTGYPLYCLVARAVTSLIPVSSVAWRYNFFSALAGAMAVGVLSAALFYLLESDGKRKALWASGGAALMLAGFYHFATQALIAEVYTFGALGLSLLFFFTVRWHLDADWRWFLSLLLMTGLSLVSHLSCVFILPGLYWWAVWCHRDRFFHRNWLRLPWLQGIGVVATAFTILAYLPLRSGLFPEPPRMQPMAEKSAYWPLDWGHPVKPADLKAHARAELYRSLLIKKEPVTIAGKTVSVPTLEVPPTQWGHRIKEWGTFIVLGFIWAMPFILLGAVYSWRQPAVAFPLLLTVGLNSLEFGYKVSDLANFFFPIYIVLGIWLAYGLVAAAKLGGKSPLEVRWYIHTGGAAGLICTVIAQWYLFSQGAGWHGRHLAYDAGLAQARAAAALEQKSGQRAVLVLPNDDFLWVYWYCRFVEGEGGHSMTPWGRLFGDSVHHGRLPASIRAWQQTGPVAVAAIPDDIVRQFSYEPANSSGNLWLVRQDPLPVPSTPVENVGAGKIRPDFQAEVRHDSLWKARDKNGVCLLRGGLAAVDTQFTVPTSWKPSPKVADAYLEILLARPKHYAGKPPIDAKREAEPGEFDETVHVWRQKWPIALPANAVSGSHYQSTVPMNLDDNAVAGPYEIWTRLTWRDHKPADWVKSGKFELVTR